MVVFCKHCGTPVKLENARLADPTYKAKCQQCQRPVAIETLGPASGASRPPASDSAAGAPRAGVPVRGTTGATAAPAAEVPAPPPERTHYLQKIRLFRGLPYEECRLLESRLRTREFAPQQTIVKEGGPGDAMFFITSGAVEVRKRDPNTGIDFLLTELKAGAGFGEMALLTGKARTASVIAVEPTTCSVLEQSAFDDVLLTSPKISLAMSRVLAERLDEADQQAGIEYINLSRLQFDARVLKLLPQQMILQHHVLPLALANNRLTLAMVNPSNLVALDDVRRVVKGVIIEPVVTSEDDFKRFMASSYADLLRREEEKQARARTMTTRKGAASEGEALGLKADSMEDLLKSLQSEAVKSLEVEEPPQSSDDVTDLSASGEDAPNIRLANSILALAIKKGASDIHVEPQEKELIVRFRVDGALEQAQVLPKKIQMGLISRFKILSKLDIAEKRLPQDGRIGVRLEDRPIDFRVSTIPCKWGEKVCMRILDRSNTLLGLDKLILQQEVLGLVREMIAQPYGIIYVTGPTGSGKTTTLYSALAELNTPDVNISTAEDPIEYDIARVNQVQTHKEIGLDFARILRSFLRQDPDIILVGETRDKETAHIAVEAALTGHLVFTTLHTNDAAGAFTRLGEMGIEPFLTSNSAIGVIAQRLTRRLCQDCKESYTPDDVSLKYLGLDPSKPLTFYRHKGCEKCSFTGFRGRVGVYEVLRMNADLRRLVSSGASAETLVDTAVKNGMKTLKDYSVWLLQNGWTTLDQVLQAVAVHA
jgi:type IV pilus assembly protein PilB